MTLPNIPVKRFNVYSRLYQRYLLEPLPAVEGLSPSLSPIIVPVTNVDDLLERTRAIEDTASFASIGLGTTTGLVCPAGLRRKVLVVEFTRTSGDRLHDILQLVDAQGGTVPGQNIRLNSKTAANFLLLLFAQPIQMVENDSLAFTITGGTTDGNWRARLLCNEEDAF